MQFTENQIAAAARALSDNHAKTCNIDKDDNWKFYSESFIGEARIMASVLATTSTEPAAPKLAGFQYRPDLAIRAVLYTDSINGTQVCRDDLWLATTADLNTLASGAAPSASASPAAPGFVLMPLRMTPEMARAAGDMSDRQYADLLAASPAAAVAAPAPAPVAGSQQVPEGQAKATHEQALAGYAVACKFGVYEARAFVLSDEMFAAFAATAPAVPVPVEQDQARDAARYRWLRDSPWSFDRPELAQIIQLQQNALWDAEIDAAMAAPSLQQGKEGASDA